MSYNNDSFVFCDCHFDNLDDLNRHLSAMSYNQLSAVSSEIRIRVANSLDKEVKKLLKHLNYLLDADLPVSGTDELNAKIQSYNNNIKKLNCFDGKCKEDIIAFGRKYMERQNIIESKFNVKFKMILF